MEEKKGEGTVEGKKKQAKESPPVGKSGVKTKIEGPAEDTARTKRRGRGIGKKEKPNEPL